MEQYRSAGLDMMHDHAQFEDGSNSLEAGIMQMADRMRGDQWKVFKGQNEGWLEEYRLYHRRNGRSRNARPPGAAESQIEPGGEAAGYDTRRGKEDRRNAHKARAERGQPARTGGVTERGPKVIPTAGDYGGVISMSCPSSDESAHNDDASLSWPGARTASVR
jgi:hypothetical protein